MEVIMATTTRTRSSGTAKRTTRPRTRKAAPAATPGLSASTRDRVNAVGKDARAVARKIQSKTSDAISAVPVNRTTISIAIGALAAVALAGIGAILGRERLMQAATASREKLRQTADDLSTAAHEKIDQARNNIHKLRTRNSASPAEMPKDEMPMAM
jgi:Mce-associated membrane protein